jgi:hypothetical protein
MERQRLQAIEALETVDAELLAGNSYVQSVMKGIHASAS